MILKALYDYYHRSGDLAPEGFEYKEIPFVIVLDESGKVINVEDRRIDKRRSQTFLVLKESRTSAPKPFAFYDNLEYVFGYIPEFLEQANNDDKKDNQEQKRKKIEEKHNLFVARCEDLFINNSDCKVFKAVNLFYKINGPDFVKSLPIWNDILTKVGANISFKLLGDTIIAASEPILNNEVKYEDSSPINSFPNCLITGLKSKPVEITAATMIPGSQAMAKLVAFQVNSGYDSYGKKQGNNAPISKSAEAAYTTALQKLLSKDSHNKFLVGDRTFLFWASSQSDGAKELEELTYSFFGYVDEKTDDPNKRIEKVKKVFSSIYSGTISSDLDDKFYILGLAPNAARIAVVYWEETSLRDFAYHILSHCEDMALIDNRLGKIPYYGLRQMMSSVTLSGKVSDVQPNLPEATIKSILQGTPYPYSLFISALKRILAEQNATIGRVAIIKAYLNRLIDSSNKKLETMVDKENVNQGYLCGRLFATLEYIQKRSSGTNSIRERYMNAASSTPSAVFSTLLNLSVHHIDKLERGIQIYFEQIKGEIIDKILADGFPAHLSLQDQGRFMVGYYHQLQEFYTKKENNE